MKWVDIGYFDLLLYNTCLSLFTLPHMNVSESIQEISVQPTIKKTFSFHCFAAAVVVGAHVCLVCLRVGRSVVTGYFNSSG